jgi:hypothetical protein
MLGPKRTIQCGRDALTWPIRPITRVERVQVYLYVNAVLYAVLALWCTLMPARTAASLGYVTLSSGGRSEYLVVYGGLQLGLAYIFFQTARDSSSQRLGLMIAISLYVPIVAYRLLTVARNWPVPSLTLGTGALEAALLAVGLWLRYSQAP